VAALLHGAMKRLDETRHYNAEVRVESGIKILNRDTVQREIAAWDRP
jgi:hypothetical protein